MAMDNMDQKAVALALQICDTEAVAIGELETLATKALGVLQEQGVYATVVFLLSRTGTKNFNDVEKNKEPRSAMFCLDRLNEADILKNFGLEFDASMKLQTQNKPGVKQNILQQYLKLSSETLEHLLFVKEFFEQTLIYVRHISKGLIEKEENNHNG